MITAKDQVIRFIQTLPGDSTLDDILYQLYLWEEEKEQKEGALVASGIPTPLPDDTDDEQPSIRTMPKPR
jgi:hypothetical protein